MNREVHVRICHQFLAYYVNYGDVSADGSAAVVFRASPGAPFLL